MASSKFQKQQCRWHQTVTRWSQIRSLLCSVAPTHTRWKPKENESSGWWFNKGKQTIKTFHWLLTFSRDDNEPQDVYRILWLLQSIVIHRRVRMSLWLPTRFFHDRGRDSQRDNQCINSLLVFRQQVTFKKVPGLSKRVPGHFNHI